MNFSDILRNQISLFISLSLISLGLLKPIFFHVQALKNVYSLTAHVIYTWHESRHLTRKNNLLPLLILEYIIECVLIVLFKNVTIFAEWFLNHLPIITHLENFNAWYCIIMIERVASQSTVLHLLKPSLKCIIFWDKK